MAHGLRLTDVEAAAAIALAEKHKMSLRIFRPQPHQDEFFKMPRPRYMLLMGGNRSGKTTCAAVMFAALALDIPVTLSDGTEVDLRMPWQKNRSLLMWVVGDGKEHIGQTIWRVLCKPDLFRVVRDPKTKELRARNPDTDRGLKTYPSRPLIPKQYIKKVAWDISSQNVFDSIVIHDPSTGRELATICAYSSKGDPKAGDPVDIIFVDERIPSEHDGKYVSELKGRLVDAGNGISEEGAGGQMFWSSWPTEDSEDLVAYNTMVEDAVARGQTDVAKKVVLTMSGNRHLDKKSIAEFLAGCTPEEAAARDKGQFATESLRMYPLFDESYHKAIIDGDEEDAISRILRPRDGLPPNDWTKYLIIDPGTNAPAALLCAVPPPELGEYYIPYQEFYPGRADAIQLAELIARDAGHERFYKFIIDFRASRQKPMGFHTRIVDEYERAFGVAGLSCYTTKNRFSPGCDDVGGRQMLLNGWMHPGKLGLPKLRIVTARCPSLCKQLSKVKKAVAQREVKDERKAPGSKCDVSDALEYFAGSHPRYVQVATQLSETSPGYQRYMKKFGQQKESSGISIGTYY